MTWLPGTRGPPPGQTRRGALGVAPVLRWVCHNHVVKLTADGHGLGVMRRTDSPRVPPTPYTDRSANITMRATTYSRPKSHRRCYFWCWGLSLGTRCQRCQRNVGFGNNDGRSSTPNPTRIQHSQKLPVTASWHGRSTTTTAWTGSAAPSRGNLPLKKQHPPRVSRANGCSLLDLNNRCHRHRRTDAAALLCSLEDPRHHGLIQIPGELPRSPALLHLVKVLGDPLQARPRCFQPPPSSVDLIRNCSKPLSGGSHPKVDYPKPEIILVPTRILVENHWDIEVIILPRQPQRIQELPNAVHAVSLVQTLEHHGSLLANVGRRIRGPLPRNRRSH
mmetsp:Transcript_75352/g.201324  ORF Transcript_75352/g.201324 Transcript_75352/m.201324 type:complete len:333 (+) Transcript_75352:799-1797(+)